jgi:asparagine synthetase B (glutamine-hydrolysing)
VYSVSWSPDGTRLASGSFDKTVHVWDAASWAAVATLTGHTAEVRAVLASGLVPGDVDPTGIATFLAYGAPQDPFTIHRAIKSFPSGSFCWIDAGAADRGAPLRPTRSWHYPRVDATATEAEELERIRVSLLEAMRDQSVADVPVLIMGRLSCTSGGMAFVAST